MTNASKSTITFSTKTPTEERIRIKQALGIGKEGGVEKYLGLPELFGRKKRDLFSSIDNRIKQKAISWSTR